MSTKGFARKTRRDRYWRFQMPGGRMFCSLVVIRFLGRESSTSVVPASLDSDRWRVVGVTKNVLAL
jgi:hypothetical protein